MYKNYLKVAFRNMSRHRLYSLINISGLSVAIACCLLITIYVKDELSYDRHHEGYRNIYRVITDMKFGHRERHYAWGPSKMAEYAKTSIPEVVESGLIRGRFDTPITHDEKQLLIKNATYASSEFFHVLSIPFIYGDPEGSLDEIGSVVISKSLALRLFNKENAIGEIIEWNNDPFLVTGVIEDIPRTSHLELDMMISNKYRETFGTESWMSAGVHTYIKLEKGADPEEVTSKLNLAVNQFIVPLVEQNLKIPAENIQSDGNRARFYLQPIKDIRLRTTFSDVKWEHGDIKTVYTISVIGIVILIIACINFINLSTARASIRGKEVGVRKVLGSKRGQLVQQFLTESVLHSLVSFVLAALIAYLALPYFTQVTGKVILNPFGGALPIWLLMIVGALILGVLAGFYPAFVLSSFTPDKTLKGQSFLKMRGSWVRGGLVVVQFVASTILIIGAIVINRQLNFIHDKPLGFAKDEMMRIEIMEFDVYENGQTAFKNELLKDPRFKSLVQTEYLPVSGSRRVDLVKRTDTSGLDFEVDMQLWPVPMEYITTVGLNVLSGRGFMQEYVSDSLAIVVNETAAQNLGLENPIGERVTVAEREFTIIGMIEDFHYSSLKNNIEPLALRLGGGREWDIAVRFNGEPFPEIVKNAWELHAGGQPFVYDLVSNQYDNIYVAEARLKLLINGFSIIAIIVAAMGLFGLAAFLAEQKKMELGIRKVLGAKAYQLIMLLFKSFGKLILIASLIALPLSISIAKGWLDEFAYRIALKSEIFVLSFVLIVVVAGIAVTYQSIKAASRNPVDNLRSE